MKTSQQSVKNASHCAWAWSTSLHCDCWRFLIPLLMLHSSASDQHPVFLSSAHHPLPLRWILVAHAWCSIFLLIHFVLLHNGTLVCLVICVRIGSKNLDQSVACIAWFITRGWGRKDDGNRRYCCCKSSGQLGASNLIFWSLLYFSPLPPSHLGSSIFPSLENGDKFYFNLWYFLFFVLAGAAVTLLTPVLGQESPGLLFSAACVTVVSFDAMLITLFDSESSIPSLLSLP